MTHGGIVAQLRQIKPLSTPLQQKTRSQLETEMRNSEIFAANVPRYTSYPTAPHFHTGIDQQIYRRWLAALPVETPLSLYLHIPFCDTLCWFCGCHTTAVNNYTPVSDYFDLLLREIGWVSAGGQTVRPLHAALPLDR